MNYSINKNPQTILAFDCAGRQLSVTLEQSGHIFEKWLDSDFKHMELLLPTIVELCRQADCRLADIQLLVYGSGPGSFTGLRIAAATAKGIATANCCPVMAINSIDGYAECYENRSEKTELLAPVIDGKKGRYYSALYRDGCRISDYLDLDAETTCRQWPEDEPVTLAGPDAAAFIDHFAATKRLRLADSIFTPAKPATALLALAKRNLAAEGLAATAQDPFYLRQADVVIGKKAKNKRQ